MTTSTVKAATLKKLASYDTPTICNVIELFEVRPNNVGYMDGRVFIGSTICSDAYRQTFDIGTAVCVGGVAFETGDLLHGDANGVTNIPLDIAAEVADVAEEFIAAETHVIGYAESAGPKQIGELAAGRAAMGEAISAFGRRISRNLSSTRNTVNGI